MSSDMWIAVAVFVAAIALIAWGKVHRAYALSTGSSHT